MLAVFLFATFLNHASTGQVSPNPALASRSVIANVIDSHGNPVRDLTNDNFAIFLNGKPAAVTTARYTLAPRRIVVLLDVSGSMFGQTNSGKWRIAEEAVRDLLAQTESDVPIAMLTFAGGVQNTFNFSRDRTAIQNWIQENADEPPRLKKRKTALFDGIIGALKLIGDAEPGDAIYAITDGGENTSEISARQAKSTLLRSGVRLFVLLFAGIHASADQAAEDAFLEMIRDSGGFAFKLVGRRVPGVPYEPEYTYDTKNREDLKAYTTELNIQVNGFWALDVNFPASAKNGNVKLVVSDSKGRERKDVVVTYPRILTSANQ